MVRASDMFFNEPGWLASTIESFREFGFPGAWAITGDEVTIRVMLQPPICTSYAVCRKHSYDLAEKAIARAEELYDVRGIDFTITQGRGLPLEPILELTIAEKGN